MKTKCPYCGQHYEMEDSAVGMTATCLTCRKDFTVSVAAAEPPPTEPQPVAVKPASEPTAARCPYCAGDIAPEAKKCRHCGEWIKRAEEVKNPIIFVILALSLGMLGVHDFYSGARNRGFVKLILTLGIPQLSIILGLVIGVIFVSGETVFYFAPMILSIALVIAFAVVAVLNIREMINCHAECARHGVDKKRFAVYVLAALTGGIWGLHDFYVERRKRGLMRLILATAGSMIVNVVGLVLSVSLGIYVIGSMLTGAFHLFMLGWVVWDLFNYPKDLNEA